MGNGRRERETEGEEGRQTFILFIILSCIFTVKFYINLRFYNLERIFNGT